MVNDNLILGLMPIINEETICKNCGRCCLIKQGLKVSEKYCSFYDKEKKRCKKYDIRKRFNCLTAKQSFDQKGLPNDCPYVEHYKKQGADYKSKITNYKQTY
jgi:uncharacterized cysteine cluster protein YcgN (CxxCxxCC family)